MAPRQRPRLGARALVAALDGETLHQVDELNLLVEPRARRGGAAIAREPALIRRISVSPESLREGTAAQQEVAAQPEARLLLAFHRLRRGSAYCRRLAHRKPAHGTPVLCLDAVDYARAPPPLRSDRTGVHVHTVGS